MKWHRMEDESPPPHFCAYFISGHEWFGIGIWSPHLGWSEGYFGEFPSEPSPDFLKNDEYLNQDVMFWANIPSYPCCGKRMLDLPQYKKYWSIDWKKVNEVD